jgi:NitT/TauT family transport system ATP-binding protein
MKKALTLEHVNKSFKDYHGHKLEALRDINLTLHEGEFFVLLGPSGCGKSTLLRIMSSLERDFLGKLEYEKDITTVDFSFVFQSFALLPWLTVEENIGLGLMTKNIPEHDVKKIVDRELIQLGLEKFARHYPRELSGGMKQRVGIARALAINPKIMFLDEPFSALDSFTAKSLREELIKIWQERQMTVVMVTHNIEEALQLGDRVAVMSAQPGKIEEVITNTLPRPRELRSPEFFTLEDKLMELVKI